MKHKLFILTAILALLALLGGCGKQEQTALGQGEYLEIPKAELSEDIRIYSVTVDGLQMEVLAAKDADGTLRTAFNTCQVCNGSRKAYFVAQGEHVICQNCGNSFARSDVGVLSGGCNPTPIFAESRADTEDTIRISCDYLQSNRDLFTRWKEN